MLGPGVRQIAVDMRGVELDGQSAYLEEWSRPSLL
jgi:hypothetical protein